MSEYPEHDKLEAVRAKTQIIGEFLAWLTGPQRCAICIVDGEEFRPDRVAIETRLAQFFGLDADALAREKQAMVAAHRARRPARQAEGEHGPS